MRVLVCGGRNYVDTKTIYKWLCLIETKLGKKIRLIIQGGAKGADHCAKIIAKQYCVPCAEFDAYWDELGKPAGPIRNGWMLEFGLPDIVLAAPGNTGTADMAAKATAAGVPVVHISDSFDWAPITERFLPKTTDPAS